MAERRRQVLVEDEIPRLLSLATDPQTRDLYVQLRQRDGAACVREAEKLITLCHIDCCWAEHLGAIASLRDGIHLYRAGGKHPLEEYQVLANESFTAMQQEIENRIGESFRSLLVTSDRIDLEAAGITKPAATWTYLINDLLDDNWELELTAQENIGLSVGAAILGPLFLCQAAYRKLRSWQRPATDAP